MPKQQPKIVFPFTPGIWIWLCMAGLSTAAQEAGVAKKAVARLANGYPTVAATGFIVANYGIQDGLSQNLSTYTYCDSRGYMWISCEEGINLFDGTRFKKIYKGEKPGDLSGERSVFITEDSSRKIWLVHHNTIDVYDTRTQFAKNYPFRPGEDKAQARPKNVFMIPGEPVWVFSTHGLYFLDTASGVYTSYRQSMPADQVLEANIYYDGYVYDKANRQLWIGSYAGIACYDFVSRQLYSRQNNPKHLPIFDCRPQQSSFKQSPGGFIYFVDNNTQMLTAFHPGSQVIKRYPLPQVDTRTLDYFALHTPPDGSVWLGIRNAGLFVLDTTHQRYLEFAIKDNGSNTIPDNYIWHIGGDYQGNVWVSHGLGVSVVAKESFEYKTIFGSQVLKELPRFSRINGIFTDEDGIIWAAADFAHLAMYDPKTNQQRVYKMPGHDSVRTNSIEGLDQRRLLIASNRGLFIFDKRTRRFEVLHVKDQNNQPIPSRFLPRSVTLPDGSIALMENTAIVRFYPATNKATVHPLHFFDSTKTLTATPFCLAPDGQGGLLLSFTTDRFNLYSWNISSGEVRPLHNRFSASLAASILVPKAIHVLPDGDLLVTDRINGFWKVHRGYQTATHFTRANGLPSDIISGFAVAGNGDIWLQTYSGLARLHHLSNTIDYFQPDYPEFGSFYYAMHIDTVNKKLYAADKNVLREIDYTTIRKKTPPFSIALSEVRVNGQLLPMGNQGLPPLKHFENNISLAIATCNYFPYAQTRIFYQLSGHSVPVELVGGNQVSLTGMKSGQYTLTIFALGENHFQSKPLSFSFTILPAWYNSWWFRMLAIMAGVAVVWLVLSRAQRRRVQQLQQENAIMKLQAEKAMAIVKERERITADLHDDLGATISSLHIYGDLATQVWETKPAESRDMVHRIANSSKALMQHLSDIVWSLKPGGEEKNAMAGRLRNYSQELLAGRGIAAIFDIDENLAASIQNPLARKNLLLIAKESINNIAKYSRATEARIVLKTEGADIVLLVTDNGIGFDERQPSEGNGLGNIRDRCRQLGGQCHIDAGPGKGVTVHCRFTMAIISYM